MTEFIKTADGYQTPQALAKEFVKAHMFDSPGFDEVIGFLEYDMDAEYDQQDAENIYSAIRDELDKIAEWYENNG